jgi:hypothetical protein
VNGGDFLNRMPRATLAISKQTDPVKTKKYVGFDVGQKYFPKKLFLFNIVSLATIKTKREISAPVTTAFLLQLLSYLSRLRALLTN